MEMAAQIVMRCFKKGKNFQYIYTPIREALDRDPAVAADEAFRRWVHLVQYDDRRDLHSEGRPSKKMTSKRPRPPSPVSIEDSEDDQSLDERPRKQSRPSQASSKPSASSTRPSSSSSSSSAPAATLPPQRLARLPHRLREYVTLLGYASFTREEQNLILSSTEERTAIFHGMMAMLATGSPRVINLARIYRHFFNPGEVPSYAVRAISDVLAAHPDLADSELYRNFVGAINVDVLLYNQPYVPPPPPSSTRSRTPTQPFNITSTSDMSYDSEGGGRRRVQPAQQPRRHQSQQREDP